MDLHVLLLILTCTTTDTTAVSQTGKNTINHREQNVTEASFNETVFAVLEINLPSVLKVSAVTTRKLTGPEM